MDDAGSQREALAMRSLAITLVSCSLIARALFGQEPPAEELAPPKAAPAPSLVLLLKEPRAPRVERVRSRWARALSIEVAKEPTASGAWARAAGERIEGGRDGASWQLDDAVLMELQKKRAKQK